MLNLSSPMTRHIFKASAILDECKRLGQMISLADQEDRLKLFELSKMSLADLRALASSRFEDRAGYISSVLDTYEQALLALATSPLSHSANRPEGCPVCGEPVLVVPAYAPSGAVSTDGVRLCVPCCAEFMEAHRKLASGEAFGTFAI